MDPFDLTDPVEGEPLRDLIGMAQRERLRRSNQRQPAKHHGPQCPVCGGELPGRYSKCMHCRSPISWVEDIPCEPGREAEARQRAAAAAEQRDQELMEDARRYRQAFWVALGVGGVSAVVVGTLLVALQGSLTLGVIISFPIVWGAVFVSVDQFCR